MGTAANIFPPVAKMDIGIPIITGNIQGNTGPLRTTVFFTAPTTGLYELAALLHVTQTDGAGTFTLNMDAPRQPSGAVPDTSITGPVTSDLALNPRLAYCAQGTQITCSVQESGTGATTYNVFLAAARTY